MALILAPTRLSAVDFFVSPNGSDLGVGTSEKPFASLEAARDAIRTLKAKSGLPQDGVTVWIRAGTYLRTAGFELTAQDSGTSEAPIVYRNAEHQPVRLIGGRFIRHFRPVTDPAILSRLDPSARGHVLEADLKAEGIFQTGTLASRGFGRPLVPAHSELFFEGKPMTLARWPNEGQFARISGFPANSGTADEHGGHLGTLTNGFFFSSDRLQRWKSLEDIWVHGYWAWDWANSYERVQSLDREQGLIKTAPPYGLYGFRPGQRFYFLNILEELDQPGEWYLDAKSSRLYFWPPSSGETGETILSLLGEPLISLRHASNITIRGLQLEATRGDGIVVEGGTNDLVAGCAIRLIGNYGVRVEGGARDTVQSCDIENTGDGGVSIDGGNRQTLAPGGHLVENCHFQKQGRWSKCYVPAVLVGGVGQRVAHNVIQDHPHCAILFSGNNHEIEFNEIHHVALETGDVGAIYAGRDWTFRGNVVRFNYIHDTGGVGMGSMGVYMDDCVSGTEIFGNVFYKVTRAAFLGGGRDHRVENNIFVDCEPAVQVDGRGLDRSPVWHDMVYGFMKQRFEEMPLTLYEEHYPALTNIARLYQSSTNGIPPEANVIAHNISVGGEWLSIGWHAQPKMLSVHDNFVGLDPGFEAPERGDFRLNDNSPMLKEGFQAIPWEQIGLQDDPFRYRGRVEALDVAKTGP